MKNILSKIFTISILTLISVSSHANTFAVGPKVGTLGLGLEGSMKINEYCNIAAGVNGFHISKHTDDGQIKYNGSLRMLTAGVTVNAHPFQNGFKVSAGGFYNGNKLDISATPSKNTTINGHNYTPAQIGKVNGSLDFKKVSPYLGIGYDSAFYSSNPWSFNCEAGVLFQGKPRAKINSITGYLQNDRQAIQDLAQDAAKGANKSYIRYYPVVSVGFKYSF